MLAQAVEGMERTAGCTVLSHCQDKEVVLLVDKVLNQVSLQKEREVAVEQLDRQRDRTPVEVKLSLEHSEEL